VRWSRWLRRRDRAGRVSAIAAETPQLVAVAPDGRRWEQAAAVNRALVEVGGFWGGVGRLYGVRPVRWVEDAVYAWVARNRSWLARLWGDPPEI
jgi:predicted DCC family thiol-disulfide oxidoreductase YuxK